jgi:hypothetical protein
MWSYYYELGTMTDDRRTFLFVHLDYEVFDGYMWMSSLPIPLNSCSSSQTRTENDRTEYSPVV